MKAADFRLAGAWLIVGAAAAGALAALIALNAGGEAHVGPWPVLRLAAGYARPAERLLAAPSPPPTAVAEAARLSRSALREFPYDNSSWLRLAYADRLQNGRLTPGGVALLQRSYDLAPIDIYAGVWRIGFVLENSQDVPRDVRQAAKREFEALWQDYGKRDDLKSLTVRVQNPAGRLSAALWLNAAKRSAAK